MIYKINDLVRIKNTKHDGIIVAPIKNNYIQNLLFFLGQNPNQYYVNIGGQTKIFSEDEIEKLNLEGD